MDSDLFVIIVGNLQLTKNGFDCLTTHFDGHAGKGYNRDWLCIKVYVLYSWSSLMTLKKPSDMPWICYRLGFAAHNITS